MTRLLAKAGVDVDPSGAAVRRMADVLEVPKIGEIEQCVFFLPHVLRIAAALGAGKSEANVRDLLRHVKGDLDAVEALLVLTIEDAPEQTAALPERLPTPLPKDVAIHFARR